VVEKGFLGELATRTLLTVACDLAAPKKPNGYSPNLLIPVLLTDFLDKLVGNESWCDLHQEKFSEGLQGHIREFHALGCDEGSVT
jgi:hypothetical protein